MYTSEEMEIILKLTDELNRHRDSYYNRNESEISDVEYDKLFDELKALEKQTGIVLANSPTQTVGYEVKSELLKVEHPIPLLSLSKTKDIDELKRFIGNEKCLLMKKYDGLTIEVLYEDGVLLQASTRGNGNIGEDITHNALTFVVMPKQIPYKGKLRLAGEAIILKKDFERINESISSKEQRYANARNLVSGSVRQLDSSKCLDRNVHFVVWDVLEGYEDKTNSRHDKLDKVIEMGFEVADFFTVFGGKTNSVSLMIDQFKEEAEEQGIPIDGMVIKYDDIKYSKSLGGTAHHNNDAIAFKFEDETAETTLREIQWQVGKTGVVTPVAIFDPVELEGTTVNKASVHNASYVEDMDLNVGDKIAVAKMNMIIPNIIENISLKSRKRIGVEFPTVCPICGEQLDIDEANGTKQIICVNYNCQGKKLAQFKNFVSKQGMDIEGLSEATLKTFIDKGWLTTFPDIYELNRYERRIVALPGFGERSYKKLMKSIEKSKSTTMDKFLTALSIPQVGKSTATILAKACDYDIVKFFDRCQSYYDWSNLEDIGEITSCAINNWANNLDNLLSAMPLVNRLTFNAPTLKAEKNNDFTGKTVVVTGTFTNMSRNEIINRLKACNANVTNSVSKKTDYLIVGDKAGSKLAKAKDLNIKTIDENTFLKMMVGE